MTVLPSPPPPERPADRAAEHSAGGVIIENGRALLILVRCHEGPEVWTFPKGRLEPGETPEAAAVREVAEETGFDCEITRELCASEYSFLRDGRRIHKDVRWYGMRRLGASAAAGTPHEVAAVEWTELEQAEKLLSYPSDLKLLRLAAAAPTAPSPRLSLPERA